jgi:hypothetical protein
MAHLGTLHDYRFEDQADDIRGSKLYGRDDEKLGTIEDVVFDHGSGSLKYVVVDTGGWMMNEFLVPADHIRQRGGKDDEYVAALSKKEIETFPPYDKEHLNDDKQWREYERDYRRASGFEETGGVLHQAGSTNILVPDSLPAEGPAPKTATGQPISGYKSPIRHREAGMMDTTATGIAQDPDAERLTFVPDALGTGRGDIKDTELGSAERKSGSSGNKPASTIGGTSGPDIVHREDDSSYRRAGCDELSVVETTIEGDAIFNAEDVAGRTHQRGNIHDADLPSYPTGGGKETQTAQGRLPNYPDASQGQRWARFEENLRRQRSKIVGSCNVCDELQNRHREDVA